MSISEYAYLWTNEKEQWVLVRTSAGYAIVNNVEQSLLMVSDSELKKYLINRMISEGNSIYDNINDAYSAGHKEDCS